MQQSRASRRDYLGCAVWAVGFLVLAVASFSVGLALRPDRDTTTTLTRISRGGVEYRLAGHTDESDDPCVTLERDGDEVTGQCGFGTPPGPGDEPDRYVVTSAELPDGTTVVFAPVPRAAETVVLRLDDGSRPAVPVRRSDAAGFSWFVHQTDRTVAGPAQLRDGAGRPVDLGG